MARDLFSRYIWLVDTIRRYGHISRSDINEHWQNSPFSQGDPLPRRTFFNYRAAIEELFKIDIAYDSATNTYYIDDSSEDDRKMTDWVLNSTTVTNLLSDSHDVSHLIVLEDVPSAREFLGDIIRALKEHHPVKFSYHPYTRVRPTEGVVVEPYFLKIFRQRWYLTGRNVADDTIKTYALDRIKKLTLSTDTFTPPADFDPRTYFADSYGIIFNHSEAKRIVIRTDSRQAKYFRALPLHPSQQEEIGDDTSIFTYRMKISEDFVQELLSHGPNVEVVEPAELRAMIVDSLTRTLDKYKKSSNKKHS